MGPRPVALKILRSHIDLDPWADERFERDPRTYLRDVLLRISKVSDVRELTPYGWKAKWAKVVEDHRASIIERLARKPNA